VFDPTLPLLDLGQPAVVFSTAGLQLPSKEELENEHLFRQMSLERIFGRAFYALAMCILRRYAFADPGVLVAVPLDETHYITNSPEGENEVKELIRDGRKNQAALVLGSHDPAADFGSETLRGLIPTRIIMRQRDPELARRSLEFLGMDPEDPQLLQLVTSDLSPVDPSTGQVPLGRRGEGLMRDAQGRIGRIRVQLPASPARAAAVLTTPPTRKQLIS
jgi:hypothetical protein